MKANHLKSCYVILVISTLLVGCSTTHKVVSLGPPENPLPPAEQPEPKPGDRIYFTNGSREKVIEIKSNHVLVRGSNSSKIQRWKNFHLPPLSWDNSAYHGTQTTTLDTDSIWPLQPGNRSSFNTILTSTNKKTGSVYTGSRRWRCKVDEDERITTLAGTFDTHKIVCKRSSNSGRPRQETIWYYSPDIQQAVLKLDRYYSSNRRSKRKEMMAYQPSMRAFDSMARGNYWQFFRKTMESTPSGQSMLWSDNKSESSINLSPLKTLQQEDGTFCRQYQLTIKSHYSKSG